MGLRRELLQSQPTYRPAARSTWAARVLSPAVITPLALFVLVVVSYGLWVSWLGLYGNDLPYIWYYHLFGPWGPGEFAAMDRPLSAVFYAASTALLGENVAAYHLFLLVLRWLSGVLLWWVLRLVWPKRSASAGLAAALFVVYPGFRQNPVSVEFILHLAVLDLFLLSLGASLKTAVQPGRAWGWMALSAAGAAGLFWLEYFAGLEILRPICLWIVTRRAGMTGARQWKRIAAAWAPALISVGAFLFWRVFVFSFPTYQPVLLEELRAAPLTGLKHLAVQAVKDMWTSLAGAWRQTVFFPNGRQEVWMHLAVFAAAAFAAGSLVILLMRGKGDSYSGGSPHPDLWGEGLLGLGLVTMLAGGSIFWVTGIPVTLAFPWDRSTLSLMLGASLAVTGLLEMLVSARYRPLIAAVLIGMAASMHLQNAREYRYEWEKLRDFTWQLTWRAPELTPGTLLLFDVIPLNRYSDSDMTALLNWTYAPAHANRQIPYKFFDLTIRLDSQHAGLPGTEKGMPVEHNHRGLFFQTTTSHTVALEYAPPGCLHILGPEDGMRSNLPDRLARVLPMTSQQWITAGGGQARPPVWMGPEPAHGWCYYFQKISLARQSGDWSAAAALGDEAFQAGLQPEDPIELLPLVEAFVKEQRYEQALELTNIAAQQPALHPLLCAVWSAAEVGASDEARNARQVSGCLP